MDMGEILRRVRAFGERIIPSLPRLAASETPAARQVEK
jgi:hypothetical protein